MTARCCRYVSPQMTCSLLEFSVAQWLVCGRSWAQFPSGADKSVFFELVLSKHNHLLTILKSGPIYTCLIYETISKPANTYKYLVFPVTRNFKNC